MHGFMIYYTGTKDETIEKLDIAIEKAKKELETSIANNSNLTAEETVKLSEKLDPLIAHKQRLLLYDCKI